MKSCIHSRILASIIFLFTSLYANIYSQVSQQDSLALVALYKSTNGNSWNHNTNWLTGPVNTWYGVTVSEGRVIKISIQHNNMEGAIPPELDNLTNLEILSLEDNQLNGSIPSRLGNLTNLIMLDLCSNQLTGSIPSDLGNLTNLSNLILYSNNLAGSIPPELEDLSMITLLDLSNNQLSGSIPAELGNLSNLIGLNLHANRLSGAIPAELGNLTNLQVLQIHENDLYGNIPAEITNAKNLEWLSADYNRITGLPDLSSLPNLVAIWIYFNQLTFEDIEPNVGVASIFNYSPQDDVGEEIDTMLAAGQSIILSVDVGGSANIYQWYKNDSLISGADSSGYSITSFTESDTGTYHCEINNAIAEYLTLYSRPIIIGSNVSTNINDELNIIPDAFVLHQNYPNPFNPVTILSWELTVGSYVDLSIYNLIGQKVVNLINEKQSTGMHKVEFNAHDLSSGVYIYKLKTGSFEQSRKMILLQ